MRTFIAIGLPESLQAELARRQAEFRSAAAASRDRGNSVKWARPEGIHLTLKFLGEITETMASRVVAALTALEPVPRFAVEVHGFGFFPDSKRPHVFWAGVSAPCALTELAAKVTTVMAALGFLPEGRPFSPHLTLARFKHPTPQPALEAAVWKAGTALLGQFEVSEFCFFESRLATGRAAEYRKLARFPLARC